MAVEKLEGGGCLASGSGVSSPRTACLWKQLLNAGICLNPGLTAKLDVNYCVDILFSLTFEVETAACSLAACPIAACSVPLLQHCLRCFSQGRGWCD